MEETSLTSDVNWSKPKLIFFRFLCAYLILFNLPFPLRFIPYLRALIDPYENTFDLLNFWVAKNILGINNNLTRFYTHSGDTTLNYIEIVTFLMLALVITLVWTLLGWKARNYQRLDQLLRIYVRYSLAATMLSYGAIKVIKSQFPSPSLERLIEPIGNASPMGLAWTFMGSSESYNIFTGGAEMLGGILLAFPQTATLGALVSAGVISNIVMLNFSYDVPVKIFSSHLFLTCIFLITPESKRLINVFILNRTVEKIETPPLFDKAWQNQLAQLVKTCFLILIVTVSLFAASYERNANGDLSIKSPLYGIWEVEEFEFDGKILPPLLTDEIRWRRVIFDSPERLLISSMTENQGNFILSFNKQLEKFSLTSNMNPEFKAEFSIEALEDTVISLNGNFSNHKIIAKLRRVDETKFLLKSRGFHWISEEPFNR